MSMTRLALVDGPHLASEYASGLARLKNATFTAVVAADGDAATRAAESLNASVMASSLDELLSKHAAAFDAVVLRGSCATRAAQIQQIAKAGKHVLAKGPLGLTVSEVDAVTQASQATNVCLMVSHSLRFVPAHQVVKQRIQVGKLGDPGLLRVHRWNPAKSANSKAGGNGATACLASDSKCNSSLGNLFAARFVAEIDLALWLFDGPPTSIYATGRQPVNQGTSQSAGQPNVDYVQLHLGFDKGGMAMIDWADTLPASSDPYFSMSLIGSKGAGYADDHHNMHLLYGGAEPKALLNSQGLGHLIAELQNFVDAVREKRDHAVTPTDGRWAVQVAQAAAMSLTTG
ncbi:MAG: Gfo/Idh/MocA family oxidoreductase, partial [Phycisphaerae bacterium]|nr:Gfo/Idh/MocA family oxidoreductase [Phycisphaerae bacterium]